MPASYENIGSEQPITLFASDHPKLTQKVTIPAGNTVAFGTVVGKITATGKFIKSLSAAVDGSETPDLIMGEAVDATAADKEGIAYKAVHVRSAALDIGAGHTAVSIAPVLRGKGIFID